MFNVFYLDENDRPRFYLQSNVSTRIEAQQWCDKFNSRYPYGKPFPNGKGFYRFSTAKVVERTK